MLSTLKCPLAFSVHFVSKDTEFSVFFQGVNTNSSLVRSSDPKILHAESSSKPSAKALWQDIWSIWMPASGAGSTDHMAQQNLQILGNKKEEKDREKTT